jgi:hypothetical protein
MNNMIKGMIDKALKDIHSEDLRKNDMFLEMFLNELIPQIDKGAELFKQDKVVMYEYLSSKIYN